MSPDWLSNLPEEVREKILTYLPLKEAGRTSVLSSKWRYTWTTIPEVIFGDTVNGSNLVNSVDAVFVLRNGPIHKFNLSSLGYYPEAFDRWILNLSRHKIRELTLDISMFRRNYKMHSSFFACDEINYINLNNCSLKLPDRFEGFKLLHTLKLNLLEVSQGEIEKLISSCPLLKELKLGILTNTVAVNIHAPDLLSLEICGVLTDLQICAPKLLSLSVAAEVSHVNEDNTRRNVNQVLGIVSDLECFRLLIHSVEYSSLAFTLNLLKNLIIDVDLEVDKENAFVLSVFQVAPNLESLDIEVYLPDEDPTLLLSKFWETVDIKKNCFKCLHTVKISVNGFACLVLSFVKFILDSAPVLVTLTIEAKEYEEDESVILTQLLRFDKASPNAQIMFVNADIM